MVEQDTSNILIKVRIFDGSILIYSIIFLLLSNSVTIEENRSLLYSRSAIIILKFCVIIGLQISVTNFNSIIGIFGGLFSVTCITHTFQIFIFIITVIVLQLTGFYPRKIVSEKYKLYLNSINYFKRNILNIKAQQYRIIEYPMLLLFIITGGVFLISSNDVVSLFISIELQSYGLYLLSALYRNSELATSAALMYFLLGGLSSCIILLGTSLLYINSGNTNLDSYYVICSISNIAEQTGNNIYFLYNINYINMSLLIILVGFLFKISAAPFHFWSPDVYDAVPTIITTFIAIVAKISILIFLLELVHHSTNNNNLTDINWTHSLFISSFLSLMVGTVLGLNQYRIKRLFAYSTISHIGFMLMSLSINSLESTQAFIFYLMQYSITNLNAFLILLGIGYTLYFHTDTSENIKNILDKDNSPIQLTSQLKGYFHINPFLALSLAVTIFSLVGVPPLMGFFGKQMILSAALDNGYIFLSLVAIFTSVISAVYYLNLVKNMFFHKPVNNLSTHLYNEEIKINLISNKLSKQLNIKISDVVLSSTLTIIISVLTLIISLFIFCSQEWLSLSNLLGVILYN